MDRAFFQTGSMGQRLLASVMLGVSTSEYGDCVRHAGRTGFRFQNFRDNDSGIVLMDGSVVHTGQEILLEGITAEDIMERAARFFSEFSIEKETAPERMHRNLSDYCFGWWLFRKQEEDDAGELNPETGEIIGSSEEPPGTILYAFREGKEAVSRAKADYAAYAAVLERESGSVLLLPDSLASAYEAKLKEDGITKFGRYPKKLQEFY